jgi:hypothetical protein
MKSINKIIWIWVIVTLFIAVTPYKLSANQSSASFQVFYDDLGPYGEWVAYPGYGYVWVPDAGPGFVPYSTQGHWIVTEYGWTWVSDYDWGWAPFHYGRWGFDNDIGWFWVPDTEWGPSWVVWRRADGYYGWQPMEPGVSVSVIIGGAYHPHYDRWVFVRDRDIERSDVYRYHVDRNEHKRIIRNSTIINRTYVDNSRHTTYISGPPADEVQRVTGHPVRRAEIQENTRPGQNFSNGQLRIYRPQVVKSESGQRPAPSKVTELRNVRRSTGSTTTNQPQNNAGKEQPRPQQTQPGINGTERRPNTVTPNDKANKVQPVQPQNTRRESQPNNGNQKGNNNVQPPRPGNTRPAGNSREGQQPENAKPQERRVEPLKPAGNNTPKPPENKGKTEEPQRRTNNTPPANVNGGERRHDEAPASNNKKNEQPKEKREEQDRRR